MNSLTYDFALRCRLGGINLNYFIVAETPILNLQTLESHSQFSQIVARLNFVSPIFASYWKKLLRKPKLSNSIPWHGLWAVTRREQLRLRSMLDAIVTHLYELNFDDFAYILRSCDHPIAQMRDRAFYRTLDPKGFWRVDKEKEPELRHTVLSLIAFHDLQEKGLDAFLAQNNGEGWMLPETVRLADYGLGHDDRAKQHQPVASRLGPRFLPWQLETSAEQSWAECERHAQNLRLLLGQPEEPSPQLPASSDGQPDYSPSTNLLGEPLQKDLFGNIVPPKKGRK